MTCADGEELTSVTVVIKNSIAQTKQMVTAVKTSLKTMKDHIVVVVKRLSSGHVTAEIEASKREVASLKARVKGAVENVKSELAQAAQLFRLDVGN